MSLSQGGRSDRSSGDEIANPGSGRSDVEKVRLGSHVRLEDEDGILDLALVELEEADPFTGRLSVVSPLGHALLGKQVGDRVRFRAPGGIVEVNVVAVNRGEVT
jgi:transcription elongation factor GreA